jgi:cell division protein FtsZ
VTRAPRMPQIEDLPPVAQNQLRVMRGEAQAATPEPRRRSLLEKLAAFGITRHDEEPAPKATNPVLAPPAAPRPLAAPVTHADFGRAQPRPQPQPQPQRASAGALDQHGRRPPVTEDDHLDIPAFLRRHPN